MARATVDPIGTRYRRFNDWVRGRLRENKKRQTELAEYLNISPPSLCQRLSGRTPWEFKEALGTVMFFDDSCDFNEILN